jgi:hypothetical protein
LAGTAKWYTIASYIIVGTNTNIINSKNITNKGIDIKAGGSKIVNLWNIFKKYIIFLYEIIMRTANNIQNTHGYNPLIKPIPSVINESKPNPNA